MAGARKLALVGDFPSTWQGWGLARGEREVAMAAPPPAHHSTVAPCFCAVWVSSTSIPSYAFPPSGPLRLSPHSQLQSSPRVCSPIPTFQLSAPVCTGGHTFQSGVHRAVARTVCVGLTLSCLPQTGHFILLLQPQMLPFCPD